MDNRLKLRFWNEEEKVMIYQDDQFLSSFLNRIYHSYNVTHPSYLPFQIEERLTQCTGIKIKDKLLYQKDKLKIGNKYIRIVEFCISLGRYVTYDEDCYKERIDAIYKGNFQRFLECENCGFIDGYTNDGIELEIIYENPELINKG